MERRVLGEWLCVQLVALALQQDLLVHVRQPRLHRALGGALLDGLGKLGGLRMAAFVCHASANRALLAASLPGFGVGRMMELPQRNCAVNVLDWTPPPLDATASGSHTTSGNEV